MAEECTRHAELVKRVEQNEKDIRSLESKNSTVYVQLAKQDTELGFIKDMLKDIKSEVVKLGEQPGKRWDTLVNAGIAGIISLVLSGAITFLLTRH